MYSIFNKVNYQDTYELESFEIIDGEVKLNIKVTCNYNYADLLDVDSGSINFVIITVNSATGKIVDWNANDMYEESVENLISTTKATFLINPNKVDSAQETIYNLHRAYYSNLLSGNDNLDVKDEFDMSAKASNRAVTSLDKYAIVSWANANYNLDVPYIQSGDGVTPYYDFSNISGNYDCTNFVSHALLAGGATKNTSSTGDSGWFYSSLSNRSTSWSGVPNLYNFLTRSAASIGPKGSGMSYMQFPSSTASRPYEAGDVIQFHNGERWRHSGIITGYHSPDGYNLGAIVTWRSGSNGWGDSNQKAEEMPYGSKRVVRLYANYTS